MHRNKHQVRVRVFVFLLSVLVLLLLTTEQKCKSAYLASAVHAWTGNIKTIIAIIIACTAVATGTVLLN